MAVSDRDEGEKIVTGIEEVKNSDARIQGW